MKENRILLVTYMQAFHITTQLLTNQDKTSKQNHADVKKGKVKGHLWANVRISDSLSSARHWPKLQDCGHKATVSCSVPV